jgi:hypothetical protein
MLGYREPLKLDRAHSPVWRQPPLPERLGIGPSSERGSICAGYVERWSETLAIGAFRSGAGATLGSSRWLHQPFLVRGVKFQVYGAAINDVMVSLIEYQGTVTGVNLYGAQVRQVVRVTGTNESFGLISSVAPIGRVQPGRVVRCVPTRLHLYAQNAAATKMEVYVLVDLTYLAPVES